MSPTAIPYELVSDETGAFLTVCLPGQSPRVIRTETQIKQVMEAINRGDDPKSVEELMDATIAVGRRLTPLSERVMVQNGQVYFDAEVVDSSITRQIVRFLESGVDDWKPLVRFMEKLAINPQDHSRDQLYGWLKGRDFTITADGDFVAYKGVTWRGSKPVSCHSGPGIVNGKRVNGHLDNSVGNVVELPRSDVDFDPKRGCSRGLHVGSWEYASSFGQGATLKVEVNPRDVVSVPTDCDWAKVRVCRYKVLEAVSAPVTTALQDDDWAYEDDLFG